MADENPFAQYVTPSAAPAVMPAAALTEDNPFSQYVPGDASPQTAASAPTESVAGDIAKSTASGLGKGTAGIVGLPGALGDLNAAASKWIAGKLGFETPENTSPAAWQKAIRAFVPNPEEAQKDIETVTGEFHKPQTTPGKYAQTVAEFVPGAAIGPEASILSRLGRFAVMPGLASETAGQITAGTEAEPYARFGGAVAGSVANPGRLITPLRTEPERQALVNILAGEGVPLTAGQRTGSRPLMWTESALGDMPGSGAPSARSETAQREAFTGAVLSRAGETANRASPEVIDGAFTRIGHNFDDLAARNQLVAGPQLGNDLVRIEGEYNDLVNPSARAPVVANTIKDIGDIAVKNGGSIPGEQYQALRSRLDRAARGARADPQLSQALFDTRNALDNAMERSISPDDLASWQNARREYRNMLVIERAATGPGSETAQGLISPSQLRTAVVGQNRRAYARGEGDFADIARAGEGILRPLPNSGTGPRQYVQHAISPLAGILAGVGGHAAGLDPIHIAETVAGTVAAPAIAGRTIFSRPVQGYLGNQLLGAPQRAGPRVPLMTLPTLGQPQQPAP